MCDRGGIKSSKMCKGSNASKTVGNHCSSPKRYKEHVVVTEKFTITNILDVVIPLQLKFCKSIHQH